MKITETFRDSGNGGLAQAESRLRGQQKAPDRRAIVRNNKHDADEVAISISIAAG